MCPDSPRTTMGIRGGGQDCCHRMSNFQAIEFFVISNLEAGNTNLSGISRTWRIKLNY